MEKTKWFLRSGDFRPEMLTTENISRLGYNSAQKTLEQLAEACNLFDSEAEAINASIAVRSALSAFSLARSERQEYIQRKRMRSDNVPHPSPTSRNFGKRSEGKVCPPHEQLLPNEQNVSRHMDDNFPANAKEIHLTTIQIQSYL